MVPRSKSSPLETSGLTLSLREATKGRLFRILMDLFQVKPEECVAFGDQYNDIEMLQLAGTSYAMSNAAPGISYYSTYVTDSVEDVLEDILAQVR